MIIPYSRQSISKKDLDAINKTFYSNWLTQGPTISEFEAKIADYCGAKYAVAVSSGTAALHLACLVTNLKNGDNAITSPFTFAATSNAIIYCGATPLFSDIQLDTGNIDPCRLAEKINSKTKAILPVHFAGLPADLREISKIARKHNLVIIEDAAHAFGAEYHGKKIGSCAFSDMTIFSFHPVKLMTTGEGGCITTNSKKLYVRLKALASHGIYRSQNLSTKRGGWFYEMRELGFNYRITDFQCALGISQLARAEYFLKKRRQIAEQYCHKLSFLLDKLILPTTQYSDRKHAWHLFPIQLRQPGNRKKLYDFLKANNIYCQVHYIPVYKHPFYRTFMSSVKCPTADKLYQSILSLPMYPDLLPREQDKVITALQEGITLK